MRKILVPHLALGWLLCTASAQVYKIDTIAGSGRIGDAGPAVEAILRQPSGIAVVDWNGTIYVSEASGHRVRRISPTGQIDTVAGTGVRGFSGDGGPANAAQLDSPYGLTVDWYGNLYIADLGNARVRKVTLDGIITTVAGGGTVTPGPDNDGKEATEYALSAPRNLAYSIFENILYISDFTGHRVYSVWADRVLATVAGTGESGFSGDGDPATNAKLSYPAGLAYDYAGILYVSDSQNHVIRKIESGVIATIPQMAKTTLFTPSGLAFDPSHELVVVDAAIGALIRLPQTGQPSVVLSQASDAVPYLQSLLVPDAANGIIRKVARDGSAEVIAGGSAPTGDGQQAKEALLLSPAALADDGAGGLYVAEAGRNRIRHIASDGIIQTVAGQLFKKGESPYQGDAEAALESLVANPSAMLTSPDGTVYFAEAGAHRVRVLIPSDGSVRTFAGTGTAGFGGDNGPAASALLDTPRGLAIDATGTIYIADSGNGRIRRVASNGVIDTVLKDLHAPYGLALDGLARLYFTEPGAKRVRRFDVISGELVDLAPAIWTAPKGLAVSANGGILVADPGRQQILKIDRSGHALPIAGNGIAGDSGDGGLALDGQFNIPNDVKIDGQGNLVIADLGNGHIRQLTPLGSPSLQMEARNAASHAPSAIAPNMLMELYNTGLSAADAPQGIVLLNSIPVPILSVDDSKILVQVPPEIQTAAGVRILVVHPDLGIVASQTAQGAAAAPALFTNGANQAAATNADGSVNGDGTPAPRGSVISLLGTGFGLGDLPVSVTAEGLGVNAITAASGFPGVVRLDVSIPSDAVTGRVEVSVAVGGVSAPVVSIAVR